MNQTILLGQGRRIVPIPRAHWEGHLAQLPAHSQSRLSFMSPAHHRVRNLVVKHLPTTGEPISPMEIAESLDLPVKQVGEILEQLERNLFFLVRDLDGAVTWAFPVTVEHTPHRLTFDSGEQIYAA
jgi:hypothetical protein